MPAILLVALIYIKEGNNRLLAFLPLLFLAQGLVHLYVQSKTYFVLFSFLFAAILVRPDYLDLKRSIKVVLFSSIGLSIFFAGALTLIGKNVNPYFKVFQGGGMPLTFIGKWPIVTPLLSIARDPMTILGTLFVFLAIPFLKRDKASLFIFSVFFCICAILFDPVVLLLGGKLFPAYERITRLYNVLPFSLAFVFPLYILDREKRYDKYKFIFITAIVIAAGFMIKDIGPKHSKIVYTKAGSLSELERSDRFYSIIRANIPVGSVALVNLPLTTWWTTYFSHYIVAHAFDFVLPPNIDQTQRKQDVEYFYKNPLDQRSLDIVRTYKVEYVFFSDNELANKNIQNFPEFQPLYHANGFAIFKIVSEAQL
jgi:hypothetical protein